ncbi:hypothetical protein AA313_de0204186 [Arthrobotrys entomopaga]|nr:hypothetical protein AA313_de0204186 [Arthrobotrys entomopaga]
MTCRKPASWKALIRWTPSSASFSASLAPVKQADRYPRNGVFCWKLQSRMSPTVRGFVTQSSRSRWLCEGSVGCDDPWPAKWNILHRSKASRISAFLNVGVIHCSPSDGYRFFNTSASASTNGRIWSACRCGV